MTPAEIALIVVLLDGDVPGQYKVCISNECALYEGTDPPYAYDYEGGIMVSTPGQAWSAGAWGGHNCRNYNGTGHLIINTGHIIDRICGYENGFSIRFMKRQDD